MNESVHDLSTFQREYLWELEIPRKQVIAVAEAIPEEAYGWRPAEDARTFSAVLVHIAAGNLMLLYRADVFTPPVMELCGGIDGDGPPQWLELVHKSFAMERSLTGKSEVLDFLKRSFDAVIQGFSASNDEELGRTREFFGQVVTARRLYLRILAHAHEHMGQAIAYARAMGFRVPWPDPVKVMEEMVAKTVSS